MRNKLLKTIIATTLGLSMAVGASVGVANSLKDAKPVYAATAVASFSRSGTTNNVTGGTFSFSASAQTDYYQDGSGTNRYIQILNETAYWTSTPSSISLTAKIGGGTGNTDLSNSVYAHLLNSDGSIISSTTTVITNHITTNTGDTYSDISIPVVESAYGIRISHVKESGYNVRYYSFALSYEASSGGDPDPVTYTNVEVSEKTTLTGIYKGEAYYECQATVSGTGSYSSVVTWSITDTDTYGTGKTIDDVATIDDNGKITFLDNVDAIYVWATAADGTTHNATGFSVSASGLLSDSIPSWTKITDSDDVSVNKVYALSNDGTNFGEAAISNSQIPLTTKFSKVGYIVLESTSGGYYARFATYENDEWVVNTGKYINWTDKTSISGGENGSTVWTLVENSSNGVYLKISGGRHLGVGSGVIKAYAVLGDNAPVYLWEVDSLPVATCATIELNGVPNDDMSIGDKATLSYTAYDSELNEWTGDVTYSIATELDENGDDTTGVVSLSATSGSSVTLTALKPGTAEISVQDKDQNATADTAIVTVLADPERLELPIGNYTVVIDASEETSSTLPSSRDYEIKAKEGRTWYQNLTVNFSGITVLTNYGEYESAKSTGALTVTNNSNARISSVEVHYYKYENDGVGVYVNDSILTPTSSTGTSGADNDLYRGYTNITGNTFALCNKNSSYTSKFYTVTITLTVAEENEEFLSLVINKGATATSFTEGDVPNATGLTVHENYTTDGSTISRYEDVTSSVVWNYSVDEIAADTTSYTVTATYGGHTSEAVTIDGFTVNLLAFKEALFGATNNSSGIGNYTSSWYSTTEGFRVDVSNANNNNGWSGIIAFGRNGSASVGSITTHDAMSRPVGKVILNITQANLTSSMKSIYLEYSNDGENWVKADTFTYSTGEQAAYMPAPATNLYYRVVFDCAAGSSNGFCRINSVKYVYSNAEIAKEAINDKYTRSSLAYNYEKEDDVYHYQDIVLRFGGMVSEALWDELENIEGYGVMFSTEKYLTDNSIASITNKYTTARENSADINAAVAATCDGTNIKNGYTALTEQKQHPTYAKPADKNYSSDEYFIWNWKKAITEDELADGFVAVAYIRTETEIIFFGEITVSAASIADSLIKNNVYEEDAFGGSLSNLASMA